MKIGDRFRYRGDPCTIMEDAGIGWIIQMDRSKRLLFARKHELRPLEGSQTGENLASTPLPESSESPCTAPETPGNGNPGGEYPIPIPAGGENGVVTGFMDLIDFECELGIVGGGRKVFATIEDCRKNRPCTEQCGIVEVEIRATRVVQPTKWSDEWTAECEVCGNRFAMNADDGAPTPSFCPNCKKSGRFVLGVLNWQKHESGA